MIGRVLLAVALSCGVAHAANEPLFLYVATTGNDANDCASINVPCLTIQAAIKKVPSWQRGVINVSPGTYSEQVNVVGYIHRFIGVWGPYDANDQCIDPAQVTINAPGGTAFWGQDHATLIIGCLTIGQAAVGIAARQFSIVDYETVRFGDVTIPVTTDPISIANCQGHGC